MKRFALNDRGAAIYTTTMKEYRRRSARRTVTRLFAAFYNRLPLWSK